MRHRSPRPTLLARLRGHRAAVAVVAVVVLGTGAAVSAPDIRATFTSADAEGDDAGLAFDSQHPSTSEPRVELSADPARSSRRPAAAPVPPLSAPSSAPPSAPSEPPPTAATQAETARPESTSAGPAPTGDTVSPQTTILSGPEDRETAAFAFTADEPASFECSLDGGAFTGCPASYLPALLDAGWHTLAVRAVDSAGNVDDSPDTWRWHTNAK